MQGLPDMSHHRQFGRPEAQSGKVSHSKFPKLHRRLHARHWTNLMSWIWGKREREGGGVVDLVLFGKMGTGTRSQRCSSYSKSTDKQTGWG